MRRKDSKYWKSEIEEMFKTIEGSDLVENRYRALKHLLIKRYNFKEGFGKESATAMLQDAVYLDRKMRLMTQGKQDKLKKQLATDYLAELGYGI